MATNDFDVFDTVRARSVVWDNHACMPLRPGDHAFLTQLEACHRSAIDIISLNVGFGDQGPAEHIAMLASFRAWILARPNRYMLVRSAADVETAKRSNRLGICFDIEGAAALGGQADMVQLYYELDVRWLLLAYNVRSSAAGGCFDDDDAGLSTFGRQIVREMNRVGMVICATHSGYRSARELIDASEAPVIFSHSNPRALCDHPRNVPDDLMIACAERGGVVGINGIGIFLGDNQPTPALMAEHIDYAVQLIGEDHVGIALDYSFDRQELDALLAAKPEIYPPAHGFGTGLGMVSQAELRAVAGKLSMRGYGVDALTKVFGGNHARIAAEIWK